MKRTIPFVLLLLSCGPGTEKTVSNDSTAAADSSAGRVLRSQYADGKTKSEVVFKDGKKNGLARTFDKDGALILELPYVDGVRQGTSKKYYPGGKVVAQTTEYKEDKIHGFQVKYRSDGSLMSEARYENDYPCAELREYLINKSLKKKYPTIKVSVHDNLKTTGVYKLKISLSERVRSVKFYEGKLTPTGCLTEGLYYLLLDEETKTAEKSWHLPPGGFVMEELNIIAVYETLLGNTAIAQYKYHLAIDNK